MRVILGVILIGRPLALVRVLEHLVALMHLGVFRTQLSKLVGQALQVAQDAPEVVLLIFLSS